MTTNNFLVETVISLVVGLATALIEKFIKTKISNRKFLDWLRKSKLFIIHIIISYLIWISGYAFISLKNISITSNLSVDIRIILIITINILIFLTRSKYSQIDGKTKVKCDLGNLKDIEIHKLKQIDDGEKLILTWDTFIKGINFLKNNLYKAGYHTPDIILGVNETGIMMANLLSSKLENKPLLGIIRTGAPIDGERSITQFETPTREGNKKPHLIVIADGEIKSGNSAKKLIEMIRDEYQIELKNIIYIVLGGVLSKDDREKKIDDIKYFGWNIDEAKYKPKLIAFYIEHPGLRGPEGLR